jgi:hypothetical protein
MAYICNNPEAYDGRRIGSGECVAFVQEAARAPHTSAWKKGAVVRGNSALRRGTAIATFDASDRYPNHSTGNHAAIYVSQESEGIWVFDQWRAQGAVRKRLIRFRKRAGSPSNDGDAFSVIE